MRVQTHTVRRTKESVQEVAFISSIYAKVCVTEDSVLNVSSQASLFYPQPCTLHPDPTLAHAHTDAYTPTLLLPVLGPQG